jgi:hypothetical protein
VARVWWPEAVDGGRHLGVVGTGSGMGWWLICEGELILCFANIQIFLQFF